MPRNPAIQPTAQRQTRGEAVTFSSIMKHVFVNGMQVLQDGEHTNAKPGRALWGPGKK